jgi:hypothetical protein
MRNGDAENSGWLAGGGEMGARMRAKDWSATPLGSPETWPQSVKMAVSICLNSRSRILLWLGPELRIIYNDTYIPFLGDIKHPAMLINKAFTARAFDISTAELAQNGQPGQQFFGIHVSNHGRVMIFAGGIPLSRGGSIIGAIGVSGGSGVQDDAVARAGASAIAG